MPVELLLRKLAEGATTADLHPLVRNSAAWRMLKQL